LLAKSIIDDLANNSDINEFDPYSNLGICIKHLSLWYSNLESVSNLIIPDRTINILNKLLPKPYAEKISKLVPDYMVMGDRGMGDMADMEMPLPENTLPMMTGDGPFGSVEMGGMFTVLQVRADQRPGDYSDPGWYKHPPGTIAYEWKGELPEPSARDTAGGQSMPAQVKPAGTEPVDTKPRSRKPSGHEGH
jgi:hypothetical protein